MFLYEDGEKEPKIVVYGHDTGDVDLWANSFEEFLYFQIVEEVADENREIHSDYIMAHIQWLNDAHKRLLTEMMPVFCTLALSNIPRIVLPAFADCFLSASERTGFDGIE